MHVTEASIFLNQNMNNCGFAKRTIMVTFGHLFYFTLAPQQVFILDAAGSFAVSWLKFRIMGRLRAFWGIMAF